MVVGIIIRFIKELLLLSNNMGDYVIVNNLVIAGSLARLSQDYAAWQEMIKSTRNTGYAELVYQVPSNFPDEYKEVLTLALADVNLPEKVVLASKSVDLVEAQKGLELVIYNRVRVFPGGQPLEEASTFN